MHVGRGGDALISLAAFWVVAALWRSRKWIVQAAWRASAAFVAAGLGATVALEWWATQLAGRWIYVDAMPRLPWLQTGLLPLLQWLLIPPLLLWLVRRQIRPWPSPKCTASR